ncbi:hypothetical protein P691DRAFT_670379 [Macrolepiota fuliginosa MF-IS2]|uniref:Uncharacterized protein n=1 Tax=Macrolepiota fuliginosa MF-IS2 TaxID=1400762 RepID=A0A9P5XAW6_9AGAR|nr:hypothetical protein P691DRAFT_670379 [Macrolepiota fuliginosa MF-IS2]
MLLSFAIADAAGALFIGAGFTLAIACLVLLSSETGGPPKRRHLLRLYIVVLMIVVIGFFLSIFLFTNTFAIFEPRTDADNTLIMARLSVALDVFLVIVISMTDGLLVWRCYMVHDAVLMGQPSSFWGKISWFIPACLWVVGFVAGVISCTRLEGPPTAILFVLNALTNIYGTAFITIRLLRHRRMARICFGDKTSMARHHGIVGILVESAAINIPIAICTAVGNMGVKSVSLSWSIVYSICTPSQVRQSGFILTPQAEHVLIGIGNPLSHPPSFPRQSNRSA